MWFLNSCNNCNCRCCGGAFDFSCRCRNIFSNNRCCGNTSNNGCCGNTFNNFF